MARLSRAALETLNNLIDEMGKEIVAGPPDVEAFMARKARIAAAVSARHPEVTEEQVYDAINPLIDAKLQKTTKDLKRFMRPHWLQWF